MRPPARERERAGNSLGERCEASNKYDRERDLRKRIFFQVLNKVKPFKKSIKIKIKVYIFIFKKKY